jgi:hypothetical protein
MLLTLTVIFKNVCTYRFMMSLVHLFLVISQYFFGLAWPEKVLCRVLALVKLKDYKRAVDDASAIINLEPQVPKS